MKSGNPLKFERRPVERADDFNLDLTALFFDPREGIRTKPRYQKKAATTTVTASSVALRD